MSALATSNGTPLSRPASLFILAGLAGGVVGWTTAGISETLVYARFLVGITSYPADNPMGIALGHTAVPFHLMLGLMLKAGLPPAFVSNLVSVAIPGLYAQAFTLIAFAISRRPLFSLVVGFLPILSLVFIEGADYPINILRAATVGILAFAWLLLIPACLGVGWRRSALVLAVLLATTHPIFAAAAIPLVLLVFFLDRSSGRFPWIAAAIAIAMAGAAWLLLWMIRPEVRTLVEPDPYFLRVYLDLWDYHRNVPIEARSIVIAIQAVATIFLLVVLRLSPLANQSAGTGAMVNFLALASLGGLAAWATFHLLRDVLPPIFLVAMPNRLLNVPEALTYPVVAAILARTRIRFLSPILFAAVLLLAALAYAEILFEFVLLETYKLAEHLGAAALAVIAGVMILRGHASPTGPGAEAEETLTRFLGGWAGAIPKAAQLSLAAAGLVIGVWALRQGAPVDARVTDYLRRLHDSGMVLIVQEDLNLDTSIVINPVLINPQALDILPYVPGLIPSYVAILSDVYGLDFFDPPRDVMQLGKIPPHTTAATWSQRSVSEWQQIRSSYNAAVVVTTPDLTLPLPKTAFGNITLYFIPEP